MAFHSDCRLFTLTSYPNLFRNAGIIRSRRLSSRPSLPSAASSQRSSRIGLRGLQSGSPPCCPFRGSRIAKSSALSSAYLAERPARQWSSMARRTL